MPSELTYSSMKTNPQLIDNFSHGVGRIGKAQPFARQSLGIRNSNFAQVAISTPRHGVNEAL
jgi:hypothetical protein